MCWEYLKDKAFFVILHIIPPPPPFLFLQKKTFCVIFYWINTNKMTMHFFCVQLKRGIYALSIMSSLTSFIKKKKKGNKCTPNTRFIMQKNYLLMKIDKTYFLLSAKGGFLFSVWLWLEPQILIGIWMTFFFSFFRVCVEWIGIKEGR